MPYIDVRVDARSHGGEILAWATTHVTWLEKALQEATSRVSGLVGVDTAQQIVVSIISLERIGPNGDAPIQLQVNSYPPDLSAQVLEVWMGVLCQAVLSLAERTGEGGELVFSVEAEPLNPYQGGFKVAKRTLLVRK